MVISIFRARLRREDASKFQLLAGPPLGIRTGLILVPVATSLQSANWLAERMELELAVVMGESLANPNRPTSAQRIGAPDGRFSAQNPRLRSG